MNLKLLFITFCLVAQVGLAEEEQNPSTIDVFVAREQVRAGDRLEVAVRINLDDGWHTYAKEPGDSGMPPSLKIFEQEGQLENEPWVFPPHQTFYDYDLTTYGYEDEVILFSAVRIPKNIETEEFDLEFSVSWAICKDVCLFFREKIPVSIRISDQASEESEQWKALRNTK